MKYLKHHRERETIFPAVIGYNRLLSDNEPTHKFLKEIGRGQEETNYEQLIRFTHRFLQDLHKVDHHSYRRLYLTLQKHHGSEVPEPKDEHSEICRRIRVVKFPD